MNNRALLSCWRLMRHLTRHPSQVTRQQNLRSHINGFNFHLQPPRRCPLLTYRRPLPSNGLLPFCSASVWGILTAGIEAVLGDSGEVGNVDPAGNGAEVGIEKTCCGLQVQWPWIQVQRLCSTRQHPGPVVNMRVQRRIQAGLKELLVVQKVGLITDCGHDWADLMQGSLSSSSSKHVMPKLTGSGTLVIPSSILCLLLLSSCCSCCCCSCMIPVFKFLFNTLRLVRGNLASTPRIVVFQSSTSTTKTLPFLSLNSQLEAPSTGCLRRLTSHFIALCSAKMPQEHTSCQCD